MPQAQEKILYSKEEARVAVGYGRRAWDYVLASKVIPVVRHGNRVFILASELEAWAKTDHPSMAPKPAAPASEPSAPAAPERCESPGPAQETPPGNAERERLLKRRRRAVAGQSR